MPGAKAFVVAQVADAPSRRWRSSTTPAASPSSPIPTGTCKDPDQVRDLVESLVRDVGLDGIETFYPPHTADQTKHCLELCEEFGLVPTGSSDFHGPTHKTFSRWGAYDTYGLGEPQVPARALGRLGRERSAAPPGRADARIAHGRCGARLACGHPRASPQLGGRSRGRRALHVAHGRAGPPRRRVDARSARGELDAAPWSTEHGPRSRGRSAAAASRSSASDGPERDPTRRPVAAARQLRRRRDELASRRARQPRRPRRRAPTAAAAERRCRAVARATQTVDHAAGEPRGRRASRLMRRAGGSTRPSRATVSEHAPAARVASDSQASSPAARPSDHRDRRRRERRGAAARSARADCDRAPSTVATATRDAATSAARARASASVARARPRTKLDGAGELPSRHAGATASASAATDAAPPAVARRASAARRRRARIEPIAAAPSAPSDADRRHDVASRASGSPAHRSRAATRRAVASAPRRAAPRRERTASGSRRERRRERSEAPGGRGATSTSAPRIRYGATSRRRRSRASLRRRASGRRSDTSRRRLDSACRPGRRRRTSIPSSSPEKVVCRDPIRISAMETTAAAPKMAQPIDSLCACPATAGRDYWTRPGRGAAATVARRRRRGARSSRRAAKAPWSSPRR